LKKETHKWGEGAITERKPLARNNGGRSSIITGSRPDKGVEA